MRDLFDGRRLVKAGLVILLLLAALATGPAHAQQQLGNREDVELKFDSTKFNNLRDGNPSYDPKAHKALVDQAAQYLVYRVTWKIYQVDKTIEGGLTSVRKRFADVMTAPATASAKNKDMMKALADALIGCFKQVFDLPFESNHQAVTCAALMLQDFGKCRQEKVHDFLMDLTKPDKDNKYTYSPFIRMCAIRGLGEFSNPNWAALDDKGGANLQQVNAKLKRDEERTDRIARFVSMPYVPQGSSPEHVDAYVFIRREGVKALAQAQVPAYSAELKKEVLGPAAYYLLYIACGGKFDGTPPITLLERMEATLGLCNMKAGEVPTYNAEFSVYAAALCLAQFTAEYNRDYGYFAKAAVGKDAKSVAPRQEALPWQVYATRFDDGLTALAANIKDSPKATTNLTLLRNKLGPTTLATIKERKKAVDLEVPPALTSFATTIRPTSPEIYPGTKDAQKLLAPQ
jgi:hypothetical protein